MSCDLANGRLEVCKTAVGGIDAIYFVNYGDYTGITYDGTNTDVIDSVAGVTTLYKFELKGTNSFDQVLNSSRENGTTFAEQTLTFTLKNQDITTHNIAKMLAYGRPHVVVKSRNGSYFFAGLEHGMEVTTANVSNGTAMGDLNGYTFTMVGQEKLLANFIDVAANTDTALATVFGGATIDTN
jgi:hypothetical protein